jgi:hypothetical protein
MRDLVILHNGRRNRVHRLLCDSPDHDATHEWHLVTAHVFVAGQ